MKHYPLLAARIFNAPLLIHPQKLDAIIAGIGPRLLGLESMSGIELSGIVQTPAPDMFATSRATARSEEGGYNISDGVAVISMFGPMVHRSRMQADCSMLWGYNDLIARAEHAMDSPDVHAIALLSDTPGGESQGAFEAAQRLYDMRGIKPMKTVADGMAASAGYLIGSATDELVVTKTGYLGSIGVVMRHVDFSKGLEADGVSITHVYAGAHKIDGNPFEPLPDGVRVDMQAEVNDLYEMFVAAVALQRGMSPESIRGTEARVYRGVAAVAAGLGDRIGTADGVIEELAALRGKSIISIPSSPTPPENNQGVSSMSGTQTPAAFSQADVDAARSAGLAAGAAEERARVTAIQAHPEAAGRSALVTTCIAQGLSVDQAGALLAASPKEASAAESPFHLAMAGLGNPAVSPAGADATAAAADAAAVKGILACATRHRAV